MSKVTEHGCRNTTSSFVKKKFNDKIETFWILQIALFMYVIRGIKVIVDNVNAFVSWGDMKQKV